MASRNAKGQCSCRMYKDLNFNESARNKSTEEQQKLRALSIYYQEDMAMLEREFGLDLSLWKQKYK